MDITADNQPVPPAPTPQAKEETWGEVLYYFKMNAREMAMYGAPVAAAWALFNPQFAITTAIVSAGWKVISAERHMHRDAYPERYVGDRLKETKRLNRMLTVTTAFGSCLVFALGSPFFAPANPGGESSRNDEIMAAAKMAITQRVEDGSLNLKNPSAFKITVDGLPCEIGDVKITYPQNPEGTATAPNAPMEITADVGFPYPYFFRTRWGKHQTETRDLPLAIPIDRAKIPARQPTPHG